MSEHPTWHEYPIEGHVCRGRPLELPATAPWRCYEGPYVGGNNVWLIHPTHDPEG